MHSNCSFGHELLSTQWAFLSFQAVAFIEFLSLNNHAIFILSRFSLIATNSH